MPGKDNKRTVNQLSSAFCLLTSGGDGPNNFIFVVYH